MKIFLDTANVDQIREAASWGILDGVTTNPSLAAKEGRDFDEVLKEIVSIVKGPISAEVVADQAVDIVEQAVPLAEVAPNIVIKIPMTAEGLKAIRTLREREIDTNCTLVFNATQGILAAKAGATYVSPFVGRLDDGGLDGMQVVGQLVQIFDNYDIPTKVLAASLRHTMHVVEAAMMGAHVATMPFHVLKQVIYHPYTEVGLKRFLDDWAAVSGG